jgi:quercetin dioxygenase-like cupin family protein
MMHPPETAEDGVTFDLEKVIAELRGEERYKRDGHVARTLVRTPDLRLVVMVLRAGASIAEHRASVTTSVHVVQGQIRMNLPDGPVELTEGRLLILAADLPHDVHADLDSAFLLTLGWNGAEK